MNIRTLSIGLTGFLCVISASTQARAENRVERNVKYPQNTSALTFQTPIELPAMGLKFSAMSHAREVTIPPPAVVRYTFTQGEKKWNEDMYSPVEIWRSSERAGRWRDEYSNTLTIAEITTPFRPDMFPRAHVTREDYDKAISGTDKISADCNDADLAKWISAFAGADGAALEVVSKKLYGIKSIRYAELPGNALCYAFCLNRRTPSSANATSKWFCAMFTFAPWIKTTEARKVIADKFFPSVGAIQVVQKQTTASKSFQAASFAGKKQKSPEFVASRQEVVGSIKNTKGWWFAETDNYIFLSDMKADSRVAIKDLQERVEYLRDAFEQFMPPRKEINAVSVIRAFARQEDYLAYVGKEQAWSGGLWSPAHKELILRPLDIGGKKLQRNELFKIAFHELFHQYVFYAFDQKESAVWFNEGNAQFYASCVISERKYVVTEDPHLAKTIDGMLAAGTVDINKFIHLTHDEFYAGAEDALLNNKPVTEEQKRNIAARGTQLRQENYSLAWALVYYLRKGATAKTSVPYSEILGRYCDALWETGDGNRATDTAFENMDMATFQRDFAAFWKSPQRRGAAARNNVFKDYNSVTNIFWNAHKRNVRQANGGDGAP